MKRVYMHSDASGVMEGYYRIHSTLSLEGPISLAFMERLTKEGYIIDFQERLNPEKLIFRDAESLIVRPRSSEEYFSIERSDGPFIEYQRMEGSPPHDPESECPNEWEIREALEHISLSRHDVAALRFSVSMHSTLTPEENAEALSSGLVCPCQSGGKYQNRITEATAGIVYFGEKSPEPRHWGGGGNRIRV